MLTHLDRLVSGRFQGEIHVDGVVGEDRAALFGFVQHAGAQQGLDAGVHGLMDAAGWRRPVRQTWRTVSNISSRLRTPRITVFMAGRP